MRENQEYCIGLLGEGALYQAVRHQLAHAYCLLPLSFSEVMNSVPRCSFLLYCADRWHPRRQHAINGRCLELGIPWLRASTEFGVGIVGPCVFPGEPGCLECADIRTMAAMAAPQLDDFICLRERLDAEDQALCQPWLLPGSLDILAQLVLQEVTASLQPLDEVKTHHALLYLELDTLLYSRHHFLPEPLCPACGNLPPDTQEAATITLQSCPKLDPRTYRGRSLKDKAKLLFETYMDAHTGMIPILAKETRGCFVSITAQIGISTGGKPRQISACGHGKNYVQAQLTAIAESLERYGGQFPKGKRTVVEGSYRQLGEQALDPTTLGLHTAEQYARPGFGFVPYHHDLVCRWVWGYSFGRQCPILVPEQYAYYGMRAHAQAEANTSFAYEISNGCALGSCLEEAIFHGMLEVAERDTFLLTWYAQLPVPRLDLRSIPDPSIRLLIEQLEEMSGYTLSVFNITLDHGIPCCWVMAVDEQNREGVPKTLCIAGSHPQPEGALVNALQELDLMLNRPPGWFAPMRERALAMLADPFAVTAMQDHSLLYGLPEAFERLRFLYQSPWQCTFRAAFGEFSNLPARMDLRDDLAALVNYYLDIGIDTIVVDQTSLEHQAQGFRCVKVIMPGMLPMTFGYQNRRTSGFQRLYHLPYVLGYRSQPLTDVEINPHPHPFP